MALTPNTNLKLLKNPLELDNKNQLTFSNKDTQFDYFNSLESTEIIEDSYYQRKDNYIEYPDHIDNIIEYNYCMYQNNNYTNKWFYCFITRMEYVTDGCTRIYITTDVFQTWQFDFIFKESFVEREMVNVADDVPGNYLLPESFELGEPISVNTYSFDELTPLYVIAYVDNAIELDHTTYNFNGGLYNGIFNGVLFIVISDPQLLQTILNGLNSDGRAEKIMSIFTIPQFACPDAINNSVTKSDYTVLAGDYFTNILIKNLGSLPTQLDGYTPINQKLRTYPFTYIGYTPKNGENKIYRFEDFEGIPSFKLISDINQNPTIGFIPQKYKNVADNISEMSTLTGYPAISWRTDYFNSWLAQNLDSVNIDYSRNIYNYNVDEHQRYVNLNNNMVKNTVNGSFIDTLFGIADLGMQGSEIGRASVNHEYDIKKMIAQVERQQLLPDSGKAGTPGTALLGYAAESIIQKNAGVANPLDFENTIFNIYTIKKEFAERIDKYWDMFGYLINMTKIPNLKNRPNWNYVKTIGANILGSIPQEDIQALKNIFNNGVTLWHNKDNFLDYSKNNR